MTQPTSPAPDHGAASHGPTPTSAVLRSFGAKLGVGLIGLGLLVIGLGWYGASGRGAQVDGTTTVTGQLPYLLSGGFLGLALVVVGTGLLVAQSARRDQARLEVMLEQRGVAGTQIPADAGGLVAAGAASFHDPACRHVDGRQDVDYITVDEALSRGLQSCRACRPESLAGA
jgi:hypothetical protein